MSSTNEPVSTTKPRRSASTRCSRWPRRHGVRVKLTLEHFREMSDHPRQRWANKPLHLAANGGTATNMADFFTGQASRDAVHDKSSPG